MNKPRIIIADCDENYVAPLQLRFVEEFRDGIDLEIITDQNYFKVLFLEPQTAEILVVSEGLYSADMQKHSVNNIFVMMEQSASASTQELNVVRLFKYTSIKQIFNEIVGKSGLVPGRDSGSKRAQIVAVYSARGGAGKTTVAMGMSACLVEKYKRVLYINAARLQHFQLLLQNREPLSSSTAYVKFNEENQDIFQDMKPLIRSESFNYLPPFKASLMALGLKYGAFIKLACAARDSGEYDFIVIDTESVFDESAAEILKAANKVVIVTTQDASSVLATNLLVANISEVSAEKYVFVCNDFVRERNNALVAQKSSINFIVNEYIEHLAQYDDMSLKEIAKASGVQKTTYLIM